MNLKISQLTATTNISSTDLIPVVDTSDTTMASSGTTKNITFGNLLNTVALPQGTLYNGKIVTSIASDNLTVALKTLAGTNPSAADPIYVRIGDTVRTITAALSKTLNAGANSFNAGSAELATKEIDYFVYLGYNTTDGVVLGFSRIPLARLYSDFSATATNEKFASISTITNAAAGDVYELIGRFNATLSAGAGYTWSIPATSIIINRPIYETRWLTYIPAVTAAGSMTIASLNLTTALYKLSYNESRIILKMAFTTGGSASDAVITTVPIGRAETDNYVSIGGGVGYAGAIMIVGQWNSASQTSLMWQNYNQGNWTVGAGGSLSSSFFYPI